MGLLLTGGISGRWMRSNSGGNPTSWSKLRKYGKRLENWIPILPVPIFFGDNMNSTVDYLITPRPIYRTDGVKIPDILTEPPLLRDDLQNKLGQFPLFKFWGPNTSIQSSKWIAESAKEVKRKYDPTLSLVYLPHLDYNLQRIGSDDPRISKDLKEIDDLCKDLIGF